MSEQKSQSIFNAYMAVDDISRNLVYIVQHKKEAGIDEETDKLLMKVCESFLIAVDTILADLFLLGKLHGLHVVDPGAFIDLELAHTVTPETEHDVLKYAITALKVQSEELKKVVESVDAKEGNEGLKVLLHESVGNVLFDILKVRSEILTLVFEVS